MRALTFTDSLKFVPDYSDPTSDEKFVLVHVTSAGICNTDLELVRGYMGFQGVLGHEFAGITDDGRRVVGEINLSCWACPTCLSGLPTQCPNRKTLGIDRHDGAFADKLLLPEVNLHPLPDSVTDQQAVFVEPLAAALQTLAITPISPHHRVVLVGAGKLGLLTGQVVAMTGCDLTLVGRHDRQRDLAKSWSLDFAMPGEVELHRADVVIDCTGSEEGFQAALDLVKPRGIIHLKSTYAGLPRINLTRAVVDEVQVHTSRCGPFPAAIRVLERDLVDVDGMVDARYPIEQGLPAFDRAAQKGTLKIILEVNPEKV